VECTVDAGRGSLLAAPRRGRPAEDERERGADRNAGEDAHPDLDTRPLGNVIARPV